MKMILKFLKKIPKSSFSFRLPPKKKLIVFDDETHNDLKHILIEKDYYILSIRGENVNKFYLNPLIFLKMILNFNGNLWTSYLIAIIKIVSPKVIITFTDNNIKFFEIAKILQDKINFFAIQNGARYDLNRNIHNFNIGLADNNINQEYFIPNFFCFGDYEVQDYTEKNIAIGKFYPVGSLRLANYLKEVGDKVLKKSLNTNYQYDILLISDAILTDFDNRFSCIGDADLMGKFVNFLIKYVRSNNKNFLCAFKRLNSHKKNLNLELEFYEKYLSKDDYEYFLKNSTLNFERNKYLSYDLMMKSELTIATYSTILRENLSLGRKSLSVNFMKNDIFEFPIDGIFKQTDCSYDEFESKLNEILKLDSKEYLKKIKNNHQFLMKFDNEFSTIDKITKIINQYLN